MAGEYDMRNIKANLVIEYQRLDLEYEIVRQLAEELRQKGRIDEADILDEAKQNLFQAVLRIKRAWKYLPDQPSCEQIRIELPD